MAPSLEEVSDRLGTDAGGFALWVGAGASIAYSMGRTPSWSKLIDEIRAKYELDELDASPSDMPRRVEQLSIAIGHRNFRRELRLRLVEPLAQPELGTADNASIVAAMAVIGARSSTVSSFNIEAWSSTPLTIGSGETPIWRTFVPANPQSVAPRVATSPGQVCRPLYFPHGLLIQGNVVMTESEYDRHLGSMAVDTAVHLAIGGDLVILGMSLGDPYLRRALMQNRRWLNDIYWLGSTNLHPEWTRVAGVTFVPVAYSNLWSTLALSFIECDTSGRLQEIYDVGFAGADVLGANIAHASGRYVEHLREKATALLSSGEKAEAQLQAFIQYMVDAGFELPGCLVAD